MRKCFVVLFLFFLSSHNIWSQTYDRKLIKECILKIDTSKYSLTHNTISHSGESLLYFYFQKEDETSELNIYLQNKEKVQSIQLLDAADFIQLDSVTLINNDYYRVKLRFMNLFKSHFLNFTFLAKMEGSDKPIVEEIKLFPYTKTTVTFHPGTDELFIGEEKTFELLTNNLKNIHITNEWTTGQDINYRLSEENGKLLLHLQPSLPDNREVHLNIQTWMPYLTDSKKIVYDLPEITQLFRVKTSRLGFLNIDKQEVTYDEQTRVNGIEIQLDNHRQLVIGKTYRLENQEQPGGPLIAELYTKSNLTNDRVLCIFRPFNFHRKSEGYLYIKDGDSPRFLTNCDITPKTSIFTVSIMHEGEDWSSNLNVYPGETVNVKIEGEGLHKAHFHWEDVLDVTSDTVLRSENIRYFRLKIPMNITQRHINLYNYATNTGTGLNLKEYQIPRKMDYISLNCGTGSRTLITMAPTVIQRSTIKDITLNFDNNKIDSNEKLFGKQYFDLDIRLYGRKGELLEIKSIKNILICPGENSPRASYYKDKMATTSSISLNSMLSNKTYNLEDFSKVQLDFKNCSEKYNEPGIGKNLEIVLQHPVIFDIDVSFPTGLLIQNLGESKSGSTAFTDNLGGISLALVAQFSFPDAEKVGKLKPYRFGAGFLAINAFNFNQSATRDLAAVLLASLYPIRPGKIFSLPIHLGLGYKFQEDIPFLMLSPGIGINF
jgi:hypothetical protein